MAVLNMIGVLNNGSRLDESLVPTNPRTPIRYTVGSSLTINVALLYPDGQAVDLTNGSPVTTLTVKITSDDDTPQEKITGTILGQPTAGIVTFALVPTAFRTLDPGRYIYDIWLVQSGNRDPVIPASPFYLEPTVLARP